MVLQACRSPATARRVGNTVSWHFLRFACHRHGRAVASGPTAASDTTENTSANPRWLVESGPHRSPTGKPSPSRGASMAPPGNATEFLPVTRPPRGPGLLGGAPVMSCLCTRVHIRLDRTRPHLLKDMEPVGHLRGQPGGQQLRSAFRQGQGNSCRYMPQSYAFGIPAIRAKQPHGQPVHDQDRLRPHKRRPSLCILFRDRRRVSDRSRWSNSPEQHDRAQPISISYPLFTNSISA